MKAAPHLPCAPILLECRIDAMLRSSPRYEHLSVRSKLPDNSVLLSELQADPDRIVARVVDTGAAVLLSHRGAPVAVLQFLSNYRKDQEER